MMISNTRHQYETEPDLRNELATKTKIETILSCQLTKLPISYHVDCCMTMYGDTKIHGWAEIKCRKNASNKYTTYMISVHKLIEGLKLAKLTKTRFYIFVQFTDTLLYYRVNHEHNITYSIGGRTVQTRDTQDIEPCAYIPMELFVEV